VHYFIDNEGFTASFKLPHPSSSILASTSSSPPPPPPDVSIDAPVLARSKGELKRMLMLNFARASNFTDYRLTACCETLVEEASHFDNVKQVVETAWRIKNQQPPNNNPILPMPESYNGMKMQLCRYKTTDKYSSDVEGLSINVIQLIQSEIAEGNWLSEETFKKLAAVAAKPTPTNTISQSPPPPPLSPESFQWDVSLRHHRLQEKVKENRFEDLVGDVQDFMEKTKLIADSCGCAFH